MHRVFLFFLLIIFLNGCQAAKDGLTQKKRSNADEFLVEKKNPLVLPPNFGDLPTPDEDKNKDQNNQSSDRDIESLLSKGKLKTSQSNTKTGTSNIESSVLDKIKNK